LVNDAAANTVGVGPPEAGPEVLLDTEVASAADVDVLELLVLPHPRPSAEAPIAASSAAERRSEVEVTEPNFLSLAFKTGSWQPTRIPAVNRGESSLRTHRLECGLTQTELADRAGVSRQLVAAVEAGRNTPAVDAALRLARVLATSVEQLFAAPPPDVVAALGGSLRPGAPLRVGRVAGQMVAAELADRGIAGANWAKPDGVLDADRLRLFPGATPAGMVLAGCDPALGVAEAILYGLGPRSLLAISAPTGTAVRALKQGRVHAAVVHGLPDRLPEPPVPVQRWHLARWQVGLGVPTRLHGQSFEAVLRSNLPVAQRDRSAASQQAFERARAAAGIGPVSGPRATGHIDAARTAAALDCAAVTHEAAARAFDMTFIALEQHVVQVWVAERWLGHAGVDALGEVLSTTAFTERAAQFGGYDLTHCGERVDAA
jgi:DNA-binding XRE family transcriptional regulator